MDERDGISHNQFRLVESPDREIHGLIVDRYPDRGFRIEGFAQVDVTSVEPDCLLIKVTPFGNCDQPSEEQILKWEMPYNFDGTDFYLAARLDWDVRNLYCRAHIILDIPRDIKVLRDEFFDQKV